MRLTPEQWLVVRDEYIKDSEASYRSLAKKYKISIVTVNEHAKRKNWPELRKEYEREKLEQSEKKPVKENDADLRFLISSLSEKIKASFAVVNPANTQAIRHLAASIKDLVELQNIDAKKDKESAEGTNTGVILLPATVALEKPPEEAESDE